MRGTGAREALRVLPEEQVRAIIDRASAVSDRDRVTQRRKSALGARTRLSRCRLAPSRFTNEAGPVMGSGLVGWWARLLAHAALTLGVGAQGAQEVDATEVRPVDSQK